MDSYKFSYSLSFDDCLTQQLFMSSRSRLIQTRRRRSQMLVPLVYIGFGLYSFIKGENILVGGVFIMVAILWILFYPKFANWRYKRYFSKSVKQSSQNLFGKTINMELRKNSIYMDMEGSSGTIEWDEFDAFAELENQFVLLMNKGNSIVIAKNDSYLSQKFVSFLTSMNVEYLDCKDWSWGK